MSALRDLRGENPVTTIDRVILIVLDSVGIGELPDAGDYGDQGSNTVGNIARQVGLQVPTLRSLGLARLVDIGDPAPPAVYVGSTTVETCLPGLLDAQALAVAPPDALASIWLGNRSRIAAHQDLPDNLACVVAGRRRFTVFPPEQLPNLYIGPLDFTPAGQPWNPHPIGYGPYP